MHFKAQFLSILTAVLALSHIVQSDTVFIDSVMTKINVDESFSLQVKVSGLYQRSRKSITYRGVW